MDRYIIDEQIDRFVRDEMLPEEKKEFLEKVNADKELRKTVLLRKLIVEAQLRKSEAEFKQELQVSAKQGKKQLVFWITTAVAVAAIVVFIVIGNMFRYQPEELYREYYSKPIVQYSRGGEGLSLEQISWNREIDSLYNMSKYEEVVAVYEANRALLESKQFSGSSGINIGLSMMELNKNNEAILLLKQLLSTEYEEEAEWLLFHLYLKAGQRKEARVMGERIVKEKGYYSAVVGEVLNKLNERVWFGK